MNETHPTASHDPHRDAPEHREEHHHEEHHGGVGTALKVFVLLIILTIISFVVGNSPLMVNTPKIGWALMIAVSCAKAMLVISFFMHLLWEANWKYVLTIPASIMSVFLVLMLVPDVGMRTNDYTEERERFAAVPREEHSGEHEDEHPEPSADSPSENSSADHSKKDAGHE